MELKNIDLKRIEPNPDNPRGINIPQEDEKLASLKDSIQAFGVMVPLVVTPAEKDKFTLIDGERRYWASKSLNMEKVPAYVIGNDVKMSEDEILFRMFQIHHNREQWGPVQQCHALEKLYKLIMSKASVKGIKDPRAQIRAVTEDIVRSTGMETGTALTRVHFLRWPASIKNKLYHHINDEGYWYICEIEAKIMIPAMTNYPEYFERVPANEIREGLFRKLEEHTLGRSTEVRRVAPYFRERMENSTKRKVLLSSFTHLYRKSEVTYGEVADELQGEFPYVTKSDPPSPKRLLTYMRTLNRAIDDFDFDPLRGSTNKSIKLRFEIENSINALFRCLNSFIEELKK